VSAGSLRLKLTANGWGLLFVAPAATFFLVVNLLPMLYALFLSFHDWNLLSANKSFVFLENYYALMRDPGFLRALLNTFLYCIITVPLGLTLALLVAVLLDEKIRAKGLFRTMYFIPVVTSVVASGYIWKWLYDPSFGLLNQVLAPIGVQLPFLESTVWALPSIALMSVWKGLGFNVVVFLAGLQGIPAYVYEAARVDGTSRWRTFTRITLPLLNPTVVFLSVMGVMHSLKIFGEVFVMSEDGGPLNSTSSIVFQVVQTSFESHDMGYGAAMTMILFLMIVAVTVFQMKVLTKKFEY
jgi:multiple sugar transport system permease protein